MIWSSVADKMPLPRQRAPPTIMTTKIAFAIGLCSHWEKFHSRRGFCSNLLVIFKVREKDEVFVPAFFAPNANESGFHGFYWIEPLSQHESPPQQKGINIS